jgi:outer membrane lipoprotein-sorting protein
MKILTLLGCLCVLTPLSLSPQTVEAVLSRMDQAAPKFKAMSADVEMVTYTAVISDKTVENGTLYMQRLSPSNVRAKIDFSKQQDARIIAFLGKIVRIYYPNLNQYQDYEVGKNSDVLNQFLLLGFGSSGKELSQGYEITAEGPEKVAGQDTTKLLLVPKDPKMQERLNKIEMWVPNSAAYPVKQQFYEPNGNYRQVMYSNVNLHLPMHGELDLKLPGKVKRQSR